jgi:hypothetical protein
MKTTDTFTAVIATILMTLTCNAVEPWRITQATDPMTDETSYMVYTTGSEVTMSEYLAYRPNLVIKITPKNATKSGSMTYTADIMLSIETDGLRRGNTPITTRYDRNAPTTEDWDTSTDRRAAFAPNWKTTMRNIVSSTNLLVRYTTTLGHVRTTRFDVRNLQPTLKEVKRRYIASDQPTIEPSGSHVKTKEVKRVGKRVGN